MAESADVHPTAGRRRREKGPPSGLALPRLERVSDTECEHSDDSAGEKEAKRQRSEPSTPVSTPRRLPYEYDAIMGITKVGTKEAEGFDEDLDSAEYHDVNGTTEESTRKDEVEQQQRSMGFQGGVGSSSLKECIDLLNAASKSAPAPLDSGVGQKDTVPRHFLLISKEKGGTFCTNCSEIVCANSVFIWVGGFVWGDFLFIKHWYTVTCRNHLRVGVCSVLETLVCWVCVSAFSISLKAQRSKNVKIAFWD